MNSKVLLSIIFSFSMLLPHVNAGTISFKEKDGSITTLTNVTVISVKEGTIIIEKDKKRRSYSVANLHSFSPSDTSSAASDRSMPGDFSDYKITILDVKIPPKSSGKDGKSQVLEINYNLSRTSSEIPRIKVPYVYLYVLVPHGTDSGEWEVLSFAYPSKAKPKGKGYDESAILEEVKGFDRPIRNEDEHNRGMNIDLRHFGTEQVKFDLKTLKSRKLLAYYIEIWGNDSIVAQKDWKDIDTRVGEKWWLRY
ncbi:MAG: hypothetical protein WC637_05975 [Victivallales bacterium]|jgi:hypothetical protein